MLSRFVVLEEVISLLGFFFFTEGIGVYYSNYYMALWQKSWNNGD